MVTLQLDMVADEKQNLSRNFKYKAQVFPSILDIVRTATADLYIKKKERLNIEHCTKAETKTKTWITNTRKR